MTRLSFEISIFHANFQPHLNVSCIRFLFKIAKIRNFYDRSHNLFRIFFKFELFTRLQKPLLNDRYDRSLYLNIFI